jgi:hypothetical protein
MREGAELLSYLRVAVDRAMPTVVVAGVSAGSAAGSVVSGLARAAHHGGLRLVAGELTGTPGRWVLRQRQLATGDAAGVVPALARGAAAGPAPGPTAGLLPAQRLAVEGQPTTGGLQAQPAARAGGGLDRWFERFGADFVVVEAPPLDTVADAALLARACDGLVLVVESAATSRAALRRAVRLAEVSGCRLIGLVVRESGRPLPGWFRRLLRGTSRGG